MSNWQNDEASFPGKRIFSDISDILVSGSEDNSMCQKFTVDELNTLCGEGNYKSMSDEIC